MDFVMPFRDVGFQVDLSDQRGYWTCRKNSQQGVMDIWDRVYKKTKQRRKSSSSPDGSGVNFESSDCGMAQASFGFKLSQDACVGIDKGPVVGEQHRCRISWSLWTKMSRPIIFH